MESKITKLFVMWFIAEVVLGMLLRASHFNAWEFQKVNFHKSNAVKQLNEEGSAGWELVSVNGNGAEYSTATMKRRISFFGSFLPVTKE